MNIVKRLSILLLLFVLSFSANAQSETDRVTLVMNQVFTTEIYSSPNLPNVVGGGKPTHGTYAYTPLGGSNFEITYTPDSDYIGFDQFTIEIWESPTSVTYATYKFDVVKSMVIPTNDYGYTSINIATGENVVSNDFATHPPLHLRNVSFTEGGTATITGESIINFTPDEDYSGMVQIKYTVCDSLGTCATGMYSLSVHDGQLENSTMDIATTKNTKLVIPLRWNHYFISPDLAPAHGTAVINDEQELVYTPNPDYAGTDVFTLISFNNQQTSKVVNVKIYDKAAPNVSAMDDIFFTPINQPVTFNVLDNDYGNYYVKGFTQPQAGSLEYTGSGNFTYTPDADYMGGVYFSYHIGDMFNPNIETALVQIGIGDQEPSKGTFDLTTSVGQPLVIKYPTAFLDYGFEIINEPDAGTLEFLEGLQTIQINGEDVSGYNMLIYFPNDGFTGIDEFDVNYCLASNGNCHETKVVMEVIDAPADCLDGCIWPGDANADGVVSVKDILQIGRFFGEIGVERADNTTDWYAHQGDDWNNPYAKTDLKFADTNGDGQITAEDTVAISVAYAKYDNLTPIIPVSTKKRITLEFGEPSISNPQPGDFVSIPLILGSEFNPAVDIYGFTFNLNYWIDAFDNEFITYNEESWLTQNDAVLSMEKRIELPRWENGRIETAITRTGKLSASGEGIIGTLNFVIDDSVDGFKLKDGKIELSMDGGEVSNAVGQTFGISGSTIQLPINLAGTGLVKIDPSQVVLYPNPADEDIHIHLNSGFLATDITIYDMQGRVMFEVNGLETNDFKLALDDFKAGMYVAKIITSDGIVNKKFNVSKGF